jgi:hypothetical protein
MDVVQTSRQLSGERSLIDADVTDEIRDTLPPAALVYAPVKKLVAVEATAPLKIGARLMTRLSSMPT